MVKVAFDVTLNGYVTALVTEAGVVRPRSDRGLAAVESSGG